MPRDPLATVLKIRRIACEEALRHLVSALDAEEQARTLAHDIERKIATEASVAMDPIHPDAAVEAYGRWLPGARKQLAQAQTALETCEVDAARRRAELTACRIALETIETLHHERAAEALHKRDTAFQRELDDRPPRHSPEPKIDQPGG